MVTTDASTVRPGRARTGRREPPGPRPRWRAVVVPTEPGGFGLTLEPVLLGLIVAPSLAGLSVGLAAVLAFLARTPLKVALVDARRGRRLPRTVLARRVLAIEIMLLGGLVAGPVLVAPAVTLVPLALVVPLLGLELWFDVRSRGRRLVPELAGSVGIAGVVAVIVLVDGGDLGLGVALWLIVAARAITSVVTVRDQVARLHGRPPQPRLTVAADLAALALASVAVAVHGDVVAGALAVAGVVLVQRVTGRDPLPRAVVLGLRQTAVGLVVVAVTALGILVG